MTSLNYAGNSYRTELAMTRDMVQDWVTGGGINGLDENVLSLVAMATGVAEDVAEDCLAWLDESSLDAGDIRIMCAQILEGWSTIGRVDDEELAIILAEVDDLPCCISDAVAQGREALVGAAMDCLDAVGDGDDRFYYDDAVSDWYHFDASEALELGAMLYNETTDAYSHWCASYGRLATPAEVAELVGADE